MKRIYLGLLTTLLLFLMAPSFAIVGPYYSPTRFPFGVETSVISPDSTGANGNIDLLINCTTLNVRDFSGGNVSFTGGVSAVTTNFTNINGANEALTGGISAVTTNFTTMKSVTVSGATVQADTIQMAGSAKLKIGNATNGLSITDSGGTTLIQVFNSSTGLVSFPFSAGVSVSGTALIGGNTQFGAAQGGTTSRININQAADSTADGLRFVNSSGGAESHQYITAGGVYTNTIANASFTGSLGVNNAVPSSDLQFVIGGAVASGNIGIRGVVDSGTVKKILVTIGNWVGYITTTAGTP